MDSQKEDVKRKRRPLLYATPTAGVHPRRAHVGTLQREAVKVSEWVIYLAQVYDCICGGNKINRPGINLGKHIDLATSVSV